MQTIPCSGCGSNLRLNDDLIGRRVKCPKCSTSFVVAPPQELVEEDPLFSIGPIPTAPPVQTATAPQAPGGTGSQATGQNLPSYLQAPPPTRTSTYDTLSGKLAEKRREKTKSAAAMQHIGLGIVMMAGAALWFIVGLFNGFIFYYPPLLFIVGIITVIKGCLGYSE